MSIVPKSIFSDVDVSIYDRNSIIEIEFSAESGDGSICSSGRAILSRQVAYRLNFDLNKILGMKPQVALGPDAIVVDALRKAGEPLTRRRLLDRIETKLDGRSKAYEVVMRLVLDGIVIERRHANTRGQSTRFYALA